MQLRRQCSTACIRFSRTLHPNERIGEGLGGFIVEIFVSSRHCSVSGLPKVLQRMETNAIILIGISIYILYEAYERFRNPPQVKAEQCWR